MRSIRYDGRLMHIRTIDLFSGIGGIRLGFERACQKASITHECVLASDISKNACKVYVSRFGDKVNPLCDITKIDPNDIPDFDVMLGGFPCQAFSSAGHRLGFEDATRGTLFFNIAKILAAKKPKAFLLENVRGLITHKKGQTMATIIGVLSDLGYRTSYKILNSKDFGVAQNRPRVYILGVRAEQIEGEWAKWPKPLSLDKPMTLADVLESGPLDQKFWMSKSYWATLVRHKERQSAKGHGFGYLIKTPTDIASTIMCGGMGKERNLLIDKNPATPLREEANDQWIRFMTPTEWEKLQGYPFGWTSSVPDSSRMRLLGNSVTVPVIEAVSETLLKELIHPTAPAESIFGKD